jgi:hypothetical protein
MTTLIGCMTLVMVTSALGLGLVGCHNKEYDTECEASLKALGIGFDNTELPRDDAARGQQIEATSRALFRWSSVEPTVKLRDVHKVALGLVDTLMERRALLATFRPQETVLAKVNSDGAPALEANAARYHTAIEAFSKTCYAGMR